MNNDTLKGKWHEVKGRLKARWGRLTDDDLQRVEGRGEELVGILQQRYGLARERAEKDCKAFFEQSDTDSQPSGGC
ncbi:MAG TPA: CsbD family protein [Planctomycetota bacterium]|nr:CsbD family protein [Planctomycetota bacterium]